jgi:hypothetical protein
VKQVDDRVFYDIAEAEVVVIAVLQKRETAVAGAATFVGNSAPNEAEKRRCQTDNPRSCS